MLVRNGLVQVLLLASVVYVAACGKSKSNDAGGDQAAGDPGRVSSGSQPTPYSTIQVGGVASLSLHLANLPAASSTSLEVSVEGDSAEYKFAVLFRSSDCSSADYSEWISSDQAITSSLGADGSYMLCVLAKGQNDDGSLKVIALTHSWIKDTKGPVIAFSRPATLGPGSTVGVDTTFVGTAVDALSNVTKVEVSLSSGANCLSANKSAFNTPCPKFVAAVLSEGWSFTVADSLFQNGQSYVLRVRAFDNAGNSAAAGDYQFTWDNTAPDATSGVTATAGLETIDVQWAVVPGALGYLVIRNPWQAVSFSPEAGRSYSSGAFVASNHQVAFSGSTASFSDTGLSGFVQYHYAVFVMDAAGNYSAASTATAMPRPLPAFQGLASAYVWGPGRRVGAEWAQFAVQGQAYSDVRYGIWSAASSGGQNFSSTAKIESQGSQSVRYQDDSQNASLFLAAKTIGVGNAVDKNVSEARLRFESGTHHKIVGNGRYLGNDALTQTFLRNTYALANDSYGNLVFTGAVGTVHVLCKETAQAYYCRGRNSGRVYTIAGVDGTGDGADGQLASAAPLGDIVSMAFDSDGNLYLGDTTFFRVRAVCYNPLSGFCFGKRQGYVYHVTGTGAAGDSSDDVSARSAPIGAAPIVAINRTSNLYIGDNGSRRIRIVCLNNSDGFCAGRTVGNTYRLAGSGVAFDAADAAVPAVSGIGEPRALAFDEKHNLFFTDADYRRVRAICNDVTGSKGFCAGKTSGRMYRVMGTGVAGDGADNVDYATATMGQSHGLIARGVNLYLSDTTYFRVRAVCFDSQQSDLCAGRAEGRVHRVAGVGASTDGANASLAVIAAIGDVRGIALDSAGNLLAADNTHKRIRLLCSQTLANSFCEGRDADYQYHLVGSGSSAAGWQLNARLTPVGSPSGLATDGVGNVYFGDASFYVRVFCVDVSDQAVGGACYGRQAGHVYIVAGTGVTGNGADNSLALTAQTGAVTGVAVDAFGNVYYADTTNRRVRTVCYNTSAAGFCSGKSFGYHYVFAGGGAASDGADNTAALNAAFGTLNGLAIDHIGNVILADSQFFRVRVVCRTTNGGGFCSGKTIGNIYRYAGTGVSGDGANAGSAASTAMALPNAVAVDALGNVYVADGQPRVRVICYDVSAGFCTGKAAGFVYRFLGTGTAGDGLGDVDAATSAIGSVFGIAVDSNFNVYAADNGYRRVRLYCHSTAAGYCADKTVGRTYRLYGSGAAAGDESSGLNGGLIALDTPNRGALSLAPSGELLWVGSAGAVRMFIP